MDMYRENILDHYKHPHNFGMLDKADFSHHEFNASCGDDLTLFVRLGKDNRVEEARFQGRGCAISMASASMLTDRMKGLSVEEMHRLTQQDIFEMLGTEVGPGRIKCALLPLKALMEGLECWEKGHFKKVKDDKGGADGKA